MTSNNRPITEIIRERFSCRTYLDKPIETEKQQRLQELMDALRAGPFGAPLRFKLAAATEQDRGSLKGLGTYGFIKGATGFIIGATKPAPMNLEDYGYALERIVLWATELGLGTCWLGGTFTRSGFAHKIAAARDELIPAVASIGHIADVEQAKKNVLRRMAGSDGRFSWERLFFDRAFGVPLSPETAGVYATPLEMVRLGPSASNKQPWRIVREGDAWHFYVQRNRNYPPGLAARLLKIADMQRVDMGIAMCHWALTAEERGLKGKWAIQEPVIPKLDALTEYIVSWEPEP
jgi:nitroreductase